MRAQIRLGLGDFAGAVSLINTVHQQAGGFATPLSIGATYTAVRDSLLKEQRILNGARRECRPRDQHPYVRAFEASERHDMAGGIRSRTLWPSPLCDPKALRLSIFTRPCLRFR